LLLFRIPKAEGREKRRRVTNPFVINFPEIAAAKDPAGLGKTESGRCDRDG
jgi:hypothetical protein